MELKDDLIDSKLKWQNGVKQIPSQVDDMDEIYHEEDPIEASLKLRKKHNGFLNNHAVVRNTKKKNKQFFFVMKLTDKSEQNSIFEVSPY